MDHSTPAVAPCNDDFTAEEVATKLGLKSTATLRNMRSLGKGPPYRKVSKTLVLYPRAEFKIWLDSLIVRPRAHEEPTLVNGSRKRASKRR